jgi:protein-tyrosine-phosphatase
VHPGAVAAAERSGLDLSDARPRLLEPSVIADMVVTVCDQAHEELEPEPTWWHWSIPDPVEAGTDAAFDAVITDLDARIAALQ